MANLCAWHRCARERGAPGRCPALFWAEVTGSALVSAACRVAGPPGRPRTASQGPCRTPLPRSEWFFSADPCTLRLGKVLNCGYLAPRRLQKSLRGRVRENNSLRGGDVAGAKSGPRNAPNSWRPCAAPPPHAPHILRSAWLCGIGSTRTSQQTLHYANVYNQQRYGYKTETFVKFGVFFIG